MLLASHYVNVYVRTENMKIKKKKQQKRSVSSYLTYIHYPVLFSCFSDGGKTEIVMNFVLLLYEHMGGIKCFDL